MPVLRVALAQINPTVGDFAGNAAKIHKMALAAHRQGADLAVFPEMALAGYPIEDLARRQDFLTAARQELEHLARNLADSGARELVVIVGLPTSASLHDTSLPNPYALAHNTAATIQDGRVIGLYHKHQLPNYAVFDEYRIFTSGTAVSAVHINGIDVAIAICEDIWQDGSPLSDLAPLKPGLLVVLNGSPFERDKANVRIPLVVERAQELDAPIAYVNLVGGQDDLVFDGDSFIVSRGGKLISRAPSFVEHLLITDIEATDAHTNRRGLVENLALINAEPTRPQHHGKAAGVISAESSQLEQVWNALVLGLRDYVIKNGFPSVVLGLSGGIDSAVCASLAVDALGADRVFGVSMPSQWSSDHSQTDAHILAQNTGLSLRTEAIADLVAPFDSQLNLSGTAAENIQARARGMVLMSLSNAEGHLVLTTGNKTELAVGYSTIYGDSVGGFAPLKDVPKMLVWDLARWRNAQAHRLNQTAPIPEASISKPPSAELRPGQLDQDTLPDYPELDAIVAAYVDEAKSVDDIVHEGHNRNVVERIIRLINVSEWKRRQGAIGPKISGMAFGRDRRLPITVKRN